MTKKSDYEVPHNVMRTIKVVQYREGRFEERHDNVVEEHFLTLEINGKILGTISCLPYQEEFLAFGFLLTEGFIKSVSDIAGWHLKDNVFSVTLNDQRTEKNDKPTFLSGCGKGITFKDFSSYGDIIDLKIQSTHIFSADKILELMREFLSLDKLHLATGGTHAAALATEDDILFMAPDIGRHNAVQKVAGWILANTVEMYDKLILTTGRISREVVFYALALGASLIASPAAPMSSAIKSAEIAGITVVGFVKGKRLTVFSHNERISI